MDKLNCASHHISVKVSEYSEQVAVFQWAAYNRGKYPELEFLFAIPNGAKLPWRKDRKGQRYSPEALRLLASGLKPGAPDIMLPCARQGHHGLYIELKVGKNKTTPEQERFLAFLASQGYLAITCWGFEAAKNSIISYLEAK